MHWGWVDYNPIIEARDTKLEVGFVGRSSRGNLRNTWGIGNRRHAEKLIKIPGGMNAYKKSRGAM